MIPRKIGEALGLKPGEELRISVLDGSLCLRRLRPIGELHGAAKGMRWKDDYRERDDKL